jgi:chromosome partitioning protein
MSLIGAADNWVCNTMLSSKPIGFLRHNDWPDQSMKRVISVAQRKGGVGKTTLAICVAGELKARGHDVTLVDSDPQSSATGWAEPGNLGFPVQPIALGDQLVAAWVQAVQKVRAGRVVIDTAPNDRSLGAVIAISDLVLIPCTPSGVDLYSTVRTLEIVNAVRGRRNGAPRLVIVPNRVDRRKLEGQQLVDELTAFDECVSAPIGDRTAFLRAFSAGFPISARTGALAYGEIRALTDLVETLVDSARTNAR